MPVLSTVGAASLRAFGAFLPSSVTSPFIVATGGTETTSGNYKYHTFTSSGTLMVTAAPLDKYIDVLLVAGGGTGYGGGGGGGGVVINEGRSISIGSYSIAVGGGGVGANGNGADSTGFGLTAIGGGAGAIFGDNSTAVPGRFGGSGGGGGGITGYAPQLPTDPGGALQPTSASGGYGNVGGASVLVGFNRVGGGGGGAGGAGSGTTAGAGRSGSPLSSNLYGGGGGNGVSVSANSGYGGYLGTTPAAGIVIVRYLYQ